MVWVVLHVMLPNNKLFMLSSGSNVVRHLKPLFLHRRVLQRAVYQVPPCKHEYSSTCGGYIGLSDSTGLALMPVS